MLSGFIYILLFSPHNTSGADIIVIILKMRKVDPKEVK